MIRGRRSMFGALLSAIVLVPATATTAAPVTLSPAEALRASLTQATAGTAKFAERAGTGSLSFVGASNGQPLQPPSGKGDSATARQFVDGYGPAFGVASPTTDLTESHSFRSSSGGAVRFQQSYRGVPVIGGQLAVQLAPSGAVVSTAGKAAVGLALDVTPTVTAAAAGNAARALTANRDHVGAASLTVDAPVLSVFDPSLWNIIDPGGQRLVWRTSVRSVTGDVNRYVLVDATTGGIALDFSQVEAALHRDVCDRNSTIGNPPPCTAPVRSDSALASGIADVDSAYDLAGLTYNFYFNTFGRDSLDGAGLRLKSTVNVCPTINLCPYQNAFWDGGTNQMYYGSGFASGADVVGHELTHGVTQFESGLLYYGQSGAINESLSDVFGELIDRSRAVGVADTTWALGEDLPIGAIRSMSNPPAFGDPDRMTSILFASTPTSDNAGVHTNSGVNNKAAFLIDSGGTFNGQTITGLGDTKTAWIYYVAQTTMLSFLSQYSDLAVILPQACTNLIGRVGVVAADCTQVAKAVVATEMASQPVSGSLPVPADCPTNPTVKNHLVVSDGAALDTRWTLSPGAFSATFAPGANVGERSIVFPDPSAAVTMTATRQAFSVPAGETYLSFRHLLSLQTGFDGGVVEFSSDGGPWTDLITDPPNPVVGANIYDRILATSTNSLSGRLAFSADRASFVTTRVSLSFLAGHSVSLRFLVGTDQDVLAHGGNGWIINNPTVYTCGTATTPDPPTSVSAAAGGQSVTVSWPIGTFDGGSPIGGFRITPLLDGVGQPPVVVGNVTSAVVTGLIAGGTYTFTVRSTNSIGSSLESAPSNTVTLAAPFSPLGPYRLMETRVGYSTVDGLFNGIGVRSAGSVTPLTVTNRGGVPSNASAVTLNVTVVDAQGSGFLTVYPCGVARPNASNLNYAAGSTIANLVTVRVGAGGQVCIYAHEITDVVVDVGGYFPAITSLTPLVPSRLLESRAGLNTVDGLQNGIGLRGAGSVTEVQVTGRAGIPSDATAVILNVTVTEAQAQGFVTVFPCGTQLPTASNLNYLTGSTIPNAVIAKIGAGGRVCVFTQSPTHLVVDASGWFPPISDYTPLDPARLMESRPGLTTVDGLYNGITIRPARSVTEIKVTGRGGVPLNATAVVLNVTVTDTVRPGFVTVYPCDSLPPTASNLNYGFNSIIPNAVIATVSPNGTVCFYTHTITQILADVSGYFTG